MLKKPFDNVKDAESHFNELYGENNLAQRARYERAFDKYKATFNEKTAYIASSSGRVEIIGNHTDHNGGKVISCAISLDTLAFFTPTDNGIIRVVSEGYKDIIVDTNTTPSYKCGNSHALVCGIVAYFKAHGFKVGGFNAFCTSNVCGGAGISSSASFEVLIAEILNFLYNDGQLSAEQKAVASQYAENVYFGKPCGLLDQSAIAYGGLKKLDFSDKSKIGVTEINNALSDYTLILINTGGSHADLTDEYAAVPAEMREVANTLGVERLIELSKEEFFNRLPEIYEKVSDRAILRAIHFYDENERVDMAENALNRCDYPVFLDAVSKSGLSSLYKLQNCYVAGLKEQPIPKALAITGEFLGDGANRVHGGGFAGCILNIVKNDKAESFIKNAKRFYDDNSIIRLHVRPVGTKVL